MAKRKDKNRHTFWKRLHFKYRLSILNENTLEEIWKLRVSMFNGIMLYLASFFLLLVIASIVIITTPIRNYLPGYLDSEIREQAIKASIKIDSLDMQQRYQEAYLQNIKDIFEGKVQPISESKVDTVTIAADDKSLQSSDSEKKFRTQYEEEEKYNLSTISTSDITPTEGITFFRPVKGVVSSKFNITSRHYGIEITTAGESVVATLQGTIVYAGYDAEAGYIIQIQHKNGYISIYKNVSALLKKTGDRVRTGEAIALMGSGKDNSQKRTLSFELWYKGNPVNPELYISF
jgi:Membrane-bound metallopeptidase